MIYSSPEEDVFQRLALKTTKRGALRSRNNPSQPEKGSDLWLLTLSDLLLLLMVFFLVLFGMTLQQQDQSPLPLEPQAAASTKPETPPAETPPAETRPADAGDPASRELLASVEKDLSANLGDGQGEEKASVTRRDDHLVLTFPERIIFDPGRAEVKSTVQPILQKVASLASTHPQLLVEVQGHTDDRPINTRRYPSNWELSVDRATQVAKSLIGLGLAPGQVTVKGFGEYRALYPNDTDSNRHKNRRVEIQFFASTATTPVLAGGAGSAVQCQP